MSSTLNNAMCRCCASQGTFKDLKTSFHWMGEEEIYSEMLRECFDITLYSTDDGDDGGICEVCITQLRNAANFKKQVQHTEEEFQRRVRDGLYKYNIVKEEVSRDDEEPEVESENENNMDDDFSGNDFEVPIKEESEPEEQRPKKRAAPRAAASRAKKPKADAGAPSTKRESPETTDDREDAIIVVVRPTGERPSLFRRTREKGAKKSIFRRNREKEAAPSIESIFHRPQEKTKKFVVLPENRPSTMFTRKAVSTMDMYRYNLETILQSSNATTIRCRGGIGYTCSYCDAQYPEPADLKGHTLEEHNAETALAPFKGKKTSSVLVKLDITSLQCTICNKYIDSLEDLIQHLTQIHKKQYYKLENKFVPFKFETDALMCCICSKPFHKFKILLQHMNTHYRNCVCNLCDAGFVNYSILRTHNEAHQLGTFNCDYCPKVFDTSRKKRNHERGTHTNVYKARCGYCNEMFRDFRAKERHLIAKHSVRPADVRCSICDMKFLDQGQLTMHTKRYHANLRPHKCEECEMSFFYAYLLRDHMVKHTGERKYECDFCHHLFVHKKALVQHLKVHYDDRQFLCGDCGEAFIQKVSLKGHMLSKHNKEYEE